MVAIPKKTGTMHVIDQIPYGGSPRPYLGMSGIGEACWRKLWYAFHWVVIEQHNARTERIFDIGHMFEQLAISDLKKAGVFVFRVDDDGNQVEMTGSKDEDQEELVGFEGHAKGHPDGRVIGLQEMPNTQALLELKTMNDDKFKTFKQKGVAVSHPGYYGQTQRYMKKMNLSVCFFLAINKNTCEYWWEFVHLDHDHASELERKEKVIIISDEPPERAYASNNYNCNWCRFYGPCHAKEEPMKNCRTCEHCDLEGGGQWSCSNQTHIEIITNGKCQDEYYLSVEEQREGCEYWEKGWGL